MASKKVKTANKANAMHQVMEVSLIILSIVMMILFFVLIIF